MTKYFLKSERPKITVSCPFHRGALGAVGDGPSHGSVWDLNSKPTAHVFELPHKIGAKVVRQSCRHSTQCSPPSLKFALPLLIQKLIEPSEVGTDNIGREGGVKSAVFLPILHHGRSGTIATSAIIPGED